MKRLIQFTAAIAVAVAVSACDNARTANNDNKPAAGTGGVAGTTGSTDADREFVQEQLAAGTAEIELGRLAQKNGTHADVKEFGAMMVQDHQHDIAAFEKAAQDNQENAAIKTFAQKTLPVLKQHLQMAQQTLEQLK